MMSLKANLLIKNIAKKFNLREKLLEAELDKIKSGLTRQNALEIDRQQKKVVEKEKTILKSEENISSEMISLEKEIIKLLLEGDRGIIEFIIQHIKPDEFKVRVHEEIADLIHSAFLQDQDLTAGAIIDKLEDEDHKLYARELTFEKYQISKSWEDINPSLSNEKILKKYSFDAVRKFKLKQVEEKISELNKGLSQITDEDEKIDLMKEIRELSRERQLIKEDLEDEDVPFNS